MMKKCIVFIIILFSFTQTFANHISGGELFYQYIGPGAAANSSKYKVTMRLFRDCHPADPMTQLLENELVLIGIYDNQTLTLQTSKQLLLERPIPSIELHTDAIPCLINAPDVCFQVGVFTATFDLPVTSDGYTLSWIRCCRANNLGNLNTESGVGGTFITSIPGTSLVGPGHNSSPQFVIKDTALVCQNKNFVLDFGASDPDGDSVSYAFCDAYLGGVISNPNPGSSGEEGLPKQLVLSPLPYKSPYSGSSPLGQAVTINSATGEITGKAPAAGRYVINVCATEWRNGKALNVHRKDFILEVGNCDYVAADPLPLAGAWCKDSTVQFSNNNSSSAIQGYQWDFGVPGATSTEATPAYTYADTGLYKIKLKVFSSAGCVDEDSVIIGVYPDFKAAFSIIGSCFETPFTFEDQSTASYGTVNSWKWNFGATNDGSDISTVQNPDYTFSSEGTRNVKLTVTSTKGCIDSVTQPVEVKSVALLTLPFKDTLICSIDTLTLHAAGADTYIWTPPYNIINANSADPYVFPRQTTTYAVSVTDAGGCQNKDSVRVSVVNSITVNAGADTTVCRTDIFTLHSNGDGIKYSWTPPDELISGANVKDPLVRADTTTTFIVTADLGKCEAKDTVIIKVVPYPQVSASADVSICYGNSTQLSADITGASFSWSQQSSLLNSNTLTPVASPVSTTSYVLTVYDTLGCPKPAIDTVVVTVIPPVRAFAGNDTSVIVNQPLQLNATGGTNYAWTPSTGMNDAFIANPLITLSALYDVVTYKVRVSTPEGCYGDDELKVTIFKTGPDIFIPTAFTPNSDGRNDILKPIPVGIKSLQYFIIYNRWGQKVFSTSSIGEGWDGTYQGKEQSTGTYVFMARATDFLGKEINKKGTLVLIR